MGRAKEENRVVKVEVVKPKIKNEDRIWAMYHRGASQSEIAKQLDMSKQNVSRVLNDAGLPTRNARGCCMTGKCAYAMQYGCRNHG